MLARVRSSTSFRVYLLGTGAALLVVSSLGGGAAAAPTGPLLGTADSFGVLAGAGVTNTGSSVVHGDLGTCPNPSITGFPPGTVGGTIHANDATACGAQSDTTIAYDDAASRAPTTTYGGPTDLGGLLLGPGVYMTPTSFAITGSLVLDGGGDPDSTFIFQAGSTLITAPNSAVSMVNGAQACNVFWQVGSSATVDVGSQFKGTVLALTSITANTNASVEGRLLARNGAVTLDANVITRPNCVTTPTTTGAPPTTAAPGTTLTTTTATTAPPPPTTTTTTGSSATTTTTISSPATTTTTMGSSATTTTTTGSPATTTTTVESPTTSSTTVVTAPAPPSTVPPPGAPPAATPAAALDFGAASPAPPVVSVTPFTPAATTSALPRTGGSPASLVLSGLGVLVLGALLWLLGLREGRDAPR